MTRLLFFILLLANCLMAQPIELNGSILQNEYTNDNRISGFFTYSNLTDESLKLELADLDENNKRTLDIKPNFGKQIKILDQKFGAENLDLVKGNFEITFYKIGTQSNNDSKIVLYRNHQNSPETLRGVGITFTNYGNDSEGEYFEIKIDWKTILSGSYTETRKCYVTKGN